MELIGELISGPASAGAHRASALNHEVGYDAMKRQAVVKGPGCLPARLRIGKLFCAFSQADKIRYGLRRFFFKQFADDVSLRCLKNGVCSGRSCQSHLPDDCSDLRTKYHDQVARIKFYKQRKFKFASVLF
jgi:hypothetical protein